MDGIDPYSLQNTNYSICPVVVINNNTPPWFFVKNKHLMLYLIVLGRIQVKNMDVYLQPLIQWFQDYDVLRSIPSDRIFTLYGICAYTTHDYPRLGVCLGKYVV